MQERKSCFITGHREIEGDEAKLKRRVKTFLFGLATMGITSFYAGGARGFDMLAEECLLELKRERKHTFPDLRLILVLPCKDQAKGWSQTDSERYERIKKEADEVVCLSDTYYKGCMHVRNRYLVDHADCGLCYVRKDEGGTVFTVAYAEKQGKKLFRL